MFDHCNICKCNSVYCFLAADSFIVNFIEVIALFLKFFRECMPPFQYRKRAAITSLFLYIKHYFLYQILSNMHQNAGNMSQNFLGKLNTIYCSKRASKIISFYIKMAIFGII